MSFARPKAFLRFFTLLSASSHPDVVPDSSVPILYSNSIALQIDCTAQAQPIATADCSPPAPAGLDYIPIRSGNNSSALWLPVGCGCSFVALNPTSQLAATTCRHACVYIIYYSIALGRHFVRRRFAGTQEGRWWSSLLSCGLR